ncbi:lipopolysaccharide biosynthesis protein [Methylobacterium sp.]|uniref:lipopolysaccharide biosynthesis protein n=1 Tax=Methylobacterium sp. TaxID=409 RepID=UPI0025D5D471|nr:lipopolysaccharide biosynthesis protein [Methylobacterium sp.]
MTASAYIRSIPSTALVPIRRRVIRASEPAAFDDGVATVPSASAGRSLHAAAAVFATRVASAGLAYASQVLIARLLGGTEYGIFAAVSVWIAILGHSANLGWSQGACRFLPAAQAAGDHDAVRGFLLAGSVISAVVGAGVAALGIAALWLEGSVPGGPYAMPLVMAALVLPVFAFQDFLEGVARSQNWAVLAIAPPYLLRQGLIMVAVVAALSAGAPAMASSALACMLAATAISAAVQAFRLRQRLARTIASGPRRYLWRSWLGACLPIAAGDLATAALSVIDVVILSLIAPPAVVGLYFAATRLQQFVGFVSYAATAATAQRFSALAASDDRQGLQRLVWNQARLTAAGTALVGGSLLLVAPCLLDLFGSGFRDALPVLAILVAGSLAASLFGPGEHLLTMLGGERRAAAITLATLALAALLCSAAYLHYGVIGAAAAMAAAVTLRAAAMALAAASLHGIGTFVIRLRGSSLARP